MINLLSIWLILFTVILSIVIILARKEFKRLIASEKENKSWKLMGGRFGFYEGAIIFSILLSTGVVALIKYFFSM